jgi:hypothetical protein
MAITEPRSDVEHGCLMTVTDRHVVRAWREAADRASRGTLGAVERVPIQIVEHHGLAARRLRRHLMPFAPLRIR